MARKSKGYWSSLWHSPFCTFLACFTSTVSLPCWRVHAYSDTLTCSSKSLFGSPICAFSFNLPRLKLPLNSITWTQRQLPEWSYHLPSNHHSDFHPFQVLPISSNHWLCISTTVSFAVLVQLLVVPFRLQKDFSFFCGFALLQQSRNAVDFFTFATYLSIWKGRPEAMRGVLLDRIFFPANSDYKIMKSSIFRIRLFRWCQGHNWQRTEYDFFIPSFPTQDKENCNPSASRHTL